MMNEENKGLLAIHKLVIEARAFSLSNNARASANLLDKVEYLIALMLELEDQSEYFGEVLKYVCDEYDFSMIYQNYSSR